MKKTLLFFAALISCSFINAQTEPLCGTIATPETEAYIQDILPQLRQYEQEYFQLASQRRSSTAFSSVPIKAHIIRPSAGVGGLSESQLNSAIANMNTFFANAFIEFFLCDGINYINSDTFYDYTTDQEGALTSTNNVPNVINIYFTNSVTTTSGSGLCGYAYFPGGPETILMNNSCTINGATLTHEMGHFFGLSHTHGNINGTLTQELVDGSNCESTGDFLCDTPADPQLSFSKVNSSCVYTAGESDANGQLFTPNPRNILSYSRSSCRDELTPQQYARIYGFYQTSRSVMACPSFNIDIAANYTQDCNSTVDVVFTDSSVGATSWQWDVDGDDVIDYTIQNPTHTYTSSGAYDVTLTISDGSNALTKVYQDYIEVGATDISTSQITLSLTTDDYPSEIAWDLKNSAGTVLYSSPNYTEGIDDFQTFTEDFTIPVNNCYTFEITDSFGDGICCGQGLGSYTLSTLEGAVIADGGNYGAGETVFMSNAVLDVDDYFTNNSISVFPNPTKGLLTIRTSNTSDLPDAFTIYNVLGQTITSQSINTVDDLTVNAESLSEGMYYVKISKGTRSSTIPFIKN